MGPEMSAMGQNESEGKSESVPKGGALSENESEAAKRKERKTTDNWDPEKAEQFLNDLNEVYQISSHERLFDPEKGKWSDEKYDELTNMMPGKNREEKEKNMDILESNLRKIEDEGKIDILEEFSAKYNVKF